MTCTVSVPLQVLSDGVVETLDRLAALLQLLNPFSSWTVADHGVLVISRLRFFGFKAISNCPLIKSYSGHCAFRTGRSTMILVACCLVSLQWLVLSQA